MRALLVEDDARLAGALRSWMGHEGISVDWITQGRQALPALRGARYDCVVLDLGLPDVAGDEVLRSLRAEGFEMPVIVATAREQVQDRVRLLDAGADDFLVKPIHLDELAARLRALQRRRGSGETVREASQLRAGSLHVRTDSRTVSVDGRYVALTNREYWLLETLLRRKGEVVPREALVEALYGWQEEPAANTIDVHVHHLRRKLGSGLIRTVRGIGYMLQADG